MSFHALLQIEAKTEKRTYSSDEAIGIQVTLRNISNHSLVVFDYGDMNGVYLFDVILTTQKRKVNLRRRWAVEKALHGFEKVALSPRQTWQAKLNLRDWLVPRGRDIVIKDGVEKDITKEIKLQPGFYEMEIVWDPLDPHGRLSRELLDQKGLRSPAVRFRIQ
jgi:hypothetical protein